jgi:Arabinose efflux permease
MEEVGRLPANGAQRFTDAPAYILSLLTIVSFFNYLDRWVIAILLEPIKQDLDLSDSQMGLIAGFAFALLYATVGLPLARIADRRSRIALLSACLAVWSAMTALTGVVRNFVELFFVRMGVGIGEAGCGPAAHSVIGDIFPRERRPLAISIFQAGGIVGQSAGLAIAGIIAQIWGWRIALMALGSLGIPLALLIYLTVREPARKFPDEDLPSESILTTFKILFARPPLRHLVIGVSVAAFGSYGMIQWVPSFFIRIHGLSLAEVGGFLGAAKGIAGVLGTVLGGIALTRLAPRDVRWELWWPMAMFGFGPAFYLASFLIADWQMALALQMIGGFFSATAGGVALAAVQSYAEPFRRATALAVLGLTSSLLGLGLGPVVVGVTSDVLVPVFGNESLRYALILSGCIPFWGAFHLWLASRSAKQFVVG